MVGSYPAVSPLPCLTDREVCFSLTLSIFCYYTKNPGISPGIPAFMESGLSSPLLSETARLPATERIYKKTKSTATFMLRKENINLFITYQRFIYKYSTARLAGKYFLGYFNFNFPLRRNRIITAAAISSSYYCCCFSPKRAVDSFI